MKQSFSASQSPPAFCGFFCLKKSCLLYDELHDTFLQLSEYKIRLWDHVVFFCNKILKLVSQDFSLFNSYSPHVHALRKQSSDISTKVKTKHSKANDD